MTLKRKYFDSLISTYGQNNARSALAERELVTLQRLLVLAFKKNSLSIESVQRSTSSGSSDMSSIHSVLDLGSGDQFLKPSFQKRNFAYSSLDITDCNFESDIFPYSDCTFDCVVSLAVVEHLRDPSNFLGESLRVLKPGGFIWLSTPNWHHCAHKFYDDYTHVKPYTPTSLVKLLSDFGFEQSVAYPNLRCKPAWSYIGPYSFFRAKYMFFFPGNAKFPVPSFLKGKSTGIFALAKKRRDS
jgi:SAM-dependent methyltransferase